MNLADRYRRLCDTPSDINEHLPTFVDLVKAHNAQHVIELGTRTGVSTIAWLYGLEATGGRLTSVDIDRRPPIGDHDRWTFIQGDDLDPDVFSQLDPADIVFIDTSHLYPHTVSELNLYRWLVKPGGVIVLHDTELARPEGAPPRPAYPVKTAVLEFLADTGWDWINYPNCFGLGVISVPSDDASGPVFHENWFPASSQAKLAELVHEVRDVPGRIIEIGSWEGKSTIALANAAHPRIVDAVDTWEGSPGEPSAVLAAGRDVYATWQANIAAATAGNVTPHRMDWRRFVNDLDDPVALVFIDAEHTYTEVADSIAAFLPLMSPGGVMCGDDVHHPPVVAAVLDAWDDEQTTADSTLWIRRLTDDD